jgi:uncharacterized protein DUF222
MSVVQDMLEHMIETMAPVACPGTDEPPEQASVPAERMEVEICQLAGDLAAATCRFLDLVGEYDASQAWAAWDTRSCAAWLAWKCQLAPGTAREHVRVARALRTLPVTHAEFAAGRMGYAKVREITRIATPATEAGLVEIMTSMTAAQAERFARAHRTCTEDQDPERGIRQPRSSLKFRSDPDNGEVALTVYLPPAEGAVVLQALRAAVGDAEHQDAKSGPEQAPDLSGDEWPPPFLADAGDLATALAGICGDWLGGKIAAADNADIYQVHIHTTAEVLAPEVLAPRYWPPRYWPRTFRPERATQVRRTFPPERRPGTRRTRTAAISKTAPQSTPGSRSGSPASPPCP